MGESQVGNTRKAVYGEAIHGVELFWLGLEIERLKIGVMSAGRWLLDRGWFHRSGDSHWRKRKRWREVTGENISELRLIKTKVAGPSRLEAVVEIESVETNVQ